MHTRFLQTVTGILIALVSGTVAAAQEYTIKLDPTEVAGTRYHLSATATQRTRTKFTGGTDAIKALEDGFDLELSADVTILDAANGWATRKSFIILDSKLTEQETSRPLVPAGTVVNAYIQNHETVYESNGTVLNGSVTRALRLVIGLHVASVGDDGLFGTTAKKRLGDRWNVDVGGAEGFLKGMGVVARREDVSGFSVLKKIENERLFIDSTFQVTNAKFPLAPGSLSDDGYIKSESSGWYPINQNDISQSSAQSVYMKVLGRRTNPGGEDSKLEITFESHTAFEVKPLPGSKSLRQQPR